MARSVEIRMGVQAKHRDRNREQDWFIRTYMTNENFPVITDVENYNNDLEAKLGQLWSYVSTLRSDVNTEVGVMWQIHLGNLNSAQIGKGAYQLHKQQINGTLAADEFTLQKLRETISENVAYLIKLAAVQT